MDLVVLSLLDKVSDMNPRLETLSDIRYHTVHWYGMQYDTKWWVTTRYKKQAEPYTHKRDWDKLEHYEDESESNTLTASESINCIEIVTKNEQRRAGQQRLGQC